MITRIYSCQSLYKRREKNLWSLEVFKALWLRSPLFSMAQHRVTVTSSRHSVCTYCLHLQGPRGLRRILHSTSLTSRPLTIRPICSFETSETDYPVTRCHFPGTPSFEICGSSRSEIRLRWWGLRPWRSLQLCRLERLYKSYSNTNQWHNFKHNSVQNSIADAEEAHIVAGTVSS